MFSVRFFISYIIKFLAKLAANSDRNKMSSSNIAIVIGPNLLWPPGDNGWEPKCCHCIHNVLLISKAVKQLIDYLSFAFLSGKIFHQSICFGNVMETQRTFVETEPLIYVRKQNILLVKLRKLRKIAALRVTSLSLNVVLGQVS